MSGIAIPSQSPATYTRNGSGLRWWIWPVGSLLVIAAVATIWGAKRLHTRSSGIAPSDKFYTVAPMDLDIRVRKDGELQAVNNVDVICMVEGRSTIVYLVKEGDNVKKGDLLVEIDSSTLRQSLQTATLEVKQADSDLRTAREMLAIQENQNAADFAAAQVDLDLAKLALKQYQDGTYPQELADAETLVKMTEITVRNKEEDLEQTKGLFAKGFVTAADVKQAELSVTTVHNDLRKAQTALKVLTKYKNPTDLATRESAVTQADQKLQRVRRTNASMLSKSQADVETKQIALQTRTKNLQKLQEQLQYCKIEAPSDGMVVYARDDDEFRMIEGAQVRERQRLIRLPDVSQMKAVLKINESRVPKLRIGQRALVRVVGVPDPVGATLTKISPMADGSSRWMNPELREYPVELVLDRTLPDMKPGLTAQAEVFVEQLRSVLTVPLASLYSHGKDSYVFVRRGDDVEPVKVQIGSASDTHAHIGQGLTAGNEVLVLAAGQGRQLLERAGIDTSAVLEQEPGAPPAAPKDQQPTQRSSRPNPNRSERARHDTPEGTPKDAPKDAAARPTPNEREANARSAAETHTAPSPAPAPNQPTAITRSAP